MITTIYLVRHAHAVYSADELNRPLSECGQEDARRVADLLKKENINVLISSPYKRAIETIEGLTGPCGVDIIIEEDFRERLLSEKPVDDFDSAIAQVWADPTFSLEGGESNVTAQERGVRALDRILERYEGNRIVVGTHGNIMALMMNHLDARYDFTFWKQLTMPDIYKLSFDNRRLIDVKRIWDTNL